jgi:hypothetical protein
VSRLVNLALYTLSVVLVCVFVLPKTVFALDDFDLYRYGKDAKLTVERKEFIVKLVLYDNESDLNDAYYQDRERPEGESVRAFALSNKDEDVCFVHIKATKLWDDRENMAIMGHEIYHCALSRHQITTYGDEEEEQTVDEQNKEMEEVAVSSSDIVVIPIEKTREELLAEDRLLELEWLREDYKKIGIVIDE